MKLRESIKKKINEVAGVIPNVNETAIKLYKGIISSIQSDNWSVDDWEEKESKELEFYGDFNVGEFNIDTAEINLVIKDSNVKEILALHEMAIALLANINRDTYKLNQTLPEEKIIIQIIFATDFNNEDVKSLGNEFNDYLVNWLETNKTKIISSLSHEVAHAYGILKKHSISTLERAYYEGAQLIGFPKIDPMREIIFDFYFSHIIENLVRPNELDTMFRTNSVTPKQFYQALTSSRIYTRFKKMRDMNYEDIIEDLKNNYINEINELLVHANAPDSILNLPDDEKIIEFLDFTSRQLRGATQQTLTKYVLEPIEIEMIIILGSESLPADKRDYIIKNTSKIMKRFPEDGVKFLKNTIKDMNREGDKMTKKISKLYHIVESQQEKPLSKLEKYKRHKK
jgi:hypothetical protein